MHIDTHPPHPQILHSIDFFPKKHYGKVQLLSYFRHFFCTEYRSMPHLSICTEKAMKKTKIFTFSLSWQVLRDQRSRTKTS